MAQGRRQETLANTEAMKLQAEQLMFDKDERIEQLLQENGALRAPPNVGRYFDTASEFGDRAERRAPSMCIRS